MAGSGSNRGVIAFTVGGALIAAAAVSGYLLHWEPKKTRDRARAEVNEFTGAWIKLRECFVGASPPSADLYEAMMIREMTRTDVVSDLAGCDALVAKAKRPGEFDSEDAAIEEAWDEVKKARSRLASALAHRTAKRPQRPPRELRRLLAEALASAENAHGALLAAAKLAETPAAPDTLPSPELAPLHGDLGTSPALADLYVENNRVLAISVVGEQRFLYLLGDGESRTTPLRPGVFVGAGSIGWGVERLDSELRIRELGEVTASPAPLERVVGRLEESARVFGAIGDDRGGRLVLLWDPQKRGGPWTLRSRAPGEPFEKRALTLGNQDATAIITSDTNLLFGRLLLSGQGRTLEWRDDLGEPAEYALEGEPCLAPRASWWFDGEALLRNVNGVTETIANSAEMPWRRHSCSDTQLIGVYYAYPPTASVRLCNQKSCPASMQLPVAIDTQLIPLLGPSGPVLAAISADIFLLWSPDRDGKGLRSGRAVRLEAGTTVLGLIEWAGELGAVVRNGSETAIAKIPL